MSVTQKLLNVQQAVSGVKKTSANPFFNSKYFDINQLLEVVKPVLSSQGLVLIQPLTNVDGQLALRTELIDGETGESLHYDCPIPANNDPQKLGSAITYYRRYALQSLLALQAEDDDAEGAMGRSKPKPAAPRRKISNDSF